ncbi:Ferritin, mitochondrial [Frankliniella fusca]|uniref:Ferritin, mitochondrial n=1 Tax=Frankliniella fusca TaxID=407009 RepID=A0AAE1GX02_9NEOP|nr:Ferritin, mitochondrial [Frankliniella fusca]KAK3928066.1 Ferritin, mitochondrial [Frankliniella fusca]KAK3928075.1 Ferritin, mitochondrial [Frankliniella fusca]
MLARFAAMLGLRYITWKRCTGEIVDMLLSVRSSSRQIIAEVKKVMSFENAQGILRISLEKTDLVLEGRLKLDTIPLPERKDLKSSMEDSILVTDSSESDSLPDLKIKIESKGEEECCIGLEVLTPTTEVLRIGYFTPFKPDPKKKSVAS